VLPSRDGFGLGPGWGAWERWGGVLTMTVFWGWSWGLGTHGEEANLLLPYSETRQDNNTMLTQPHPPSPGGPTERSPGRQPGDS